jgi:hypothetical protein
MAVKHFNFLWIGRTVTHHHITGLIGFNSPQPLLPQPHKMSFHFSGIIKKIESDSLLKTKPSAKEQQE